MQKVVVAFCRLGVVECALSPQLFAAVLLGFKAALKPSRDGALAHRL